MGFKSKSLARVDLIFALSLVIFFALIFLTVKTTEEETAGRTLEDRTYVILTKLEKLLSHTIDVETGSRGYAISGNESFLEPMENGRHAVTAILDSLNELMLDQEQKSRLDTLNSMIQRKIQFSENAVSVRRNQGVDSTLTYISGGEGKRIMDSIRRIVGRATNRELVLLSDRSAVTDSKQHAREVYFILLSLAALLVMVAAYFIIRRNLISLLKNKEVQEDLIGELSYQNKQLDDFAHITSHNIRGPVRNINALVGMVDANSPVSEFQLMFSKIEKVAKNLSDTLNELLEVLHIKKNKAAERTKLSFQNIFLKEKENLEGEILKTKAEVYFDFSNAPTIEYPKPYLESIFHNLIGNALKYRSPDRPPVIRVTTDLKDGRVLLQVSDNGLGIDLARYGDKLFGLRKTFHEHPDARGIGLFMTKAQIETLGGKIDVQSKVGEGTVFTVRF